MVWHPKIRKKEIPCKICGKPTTRLKYCPQCAHDVKKKMMREYYQDKKRPHDDPPPIIIEKVIEHPPFAWDEPNDKYFG